MYYTLTKQQEEDFLLKPETGMGYQVIDAYKSGTYLKNRYIVLNAQVVVDMDNNQSENIRKIINEGITRIKNSAAVIKFSSSSIKLFNENEFRNLLNEPNAISKSGAIEGPKEYADGKEIFVRLSAFEDDLRIDKIKKCLRPGSFTTTMLDYTNCKTNNLNPNDRYALPNNDKIEWAFYIQPLSIDVLQRGVVQVANGKSGGGKEIYFEVGTSEKTYKGITNIN